MKTKLIVTGLMVVLAAAVMFSACGKKTEKSKAPQAAGQQAVYTCPMHPEVVSNAPGKCPKCGMNLVVKGSGGMETGHEGHNH